MQKYRKIIKAHKIWQNKFLSIINKWFQLHFKFTNLQVAYKNKFMLFARNLGKEIVKSEK